MDKNSDEFQLKLNAYLEYNWHYNIVWNEEDQIYYSKIIEIPDLLSHGYTVHEAYTSIRYGLKQHIEALLIDNIDLIYNNKKAEVIKEIKNIECEVKPFYDEYKAKAVDKEREYEYLAGFGKTIKDAVKDAYEAAEFIYKGSGWSVIEEDNPLLIHDPETDITKFTINTYKYKLIFN